MANILNDLQKPNSFIVIHPILEKWNEYIQYN